MPEETKTALVNSFRRLLLTRPFDKIKVSDVTSDCGLSRQAFYYHFDDVFDVVRWVYLSHAADVRDPPRPETLEEGALAVLSRTVLEKAIVRGAYDSRYRQRLNEYYLEESMRFVDRVVSDRSAGTIERGDREFLVRAYSYAFAGTIMRWIGDGMREDPLVLCRRIGTLVDAGFDRALTAFGRPGTSA